VPAQHGRGVSAVRAPGGAAPLSVRVPSGMPSHGSATGYLKDVAERVWLPRLGAGEASCGPCGRGGNPAT
jgi:hypothetical protein